ncbi:MAG: DNA polymerase III subunit delta' [Burkholderiaceae bacterium]
MVGQADNSSLPWLAAPLREALALRAAHAVLLHGPDGNGQFELAVALAQAYLCEARRTSAMLEPFCGTCASCHLFLVRTHPDFMLVVPDSMRESLGWPDAESVGEGGTPGGTAKAKPSKEIRVDAVRAVISFAQSTSARRRGKTVVIHPTERMNAVAANALLKTLEEPAGETRFILSSSAPDALLPTVRSRCLGIRIALPSQELASAWLAEKGVGQPQVLLAAMGGRPIAVLELMRLGIDANSWLGLPRRVGQGSVESFGDWPLTRVVETLQKICHDALCVAVGATPRYFPRQSLAVAKDVAALTAWAADLRRQAMQAQHPWQASLKLESLIQQAHRALHAPGQDRNPPERAPERDSNSRGSLHSSA